MKTGRCGKCWMWWKLLPNGKLRVHMVPNISGTVWSRCAGSLQEQLR